jgi:inorganic triphosphatase YgiF
MLTARAGRGKSGRGAARGARRRRAAPRGGRESGAARRGRGPRGAAGPGREIELKLAAPTGDLAALFRHPLVRALARGRPATSRLRTLYYDTPAFDLRRRRLALRVRREGRRFVQALKLERPARRGLAVRGEWEAQVRGCEPDLARIPDSAARARARAAAAGKPLLPVFETDFERTSLRLSRGRSAVLLAADVGEIRAVAARARTGAGGAGRARAEIREVELELVRGDPRALREIAALLRRVLPLRVEARSKAERGYALARRARPAGRARRARPRDQDRDRERPRERRSSSATARGGATIR